MSSVRLPRAIINRLLTHAQHNAEEEVCGLIGARDGEPASVYAVPNTATERDHLFAMDGKGQIDAMRTMRERDETLFAIYHSHPHAPAAPSPTDIAQAAYPEALYLIISLNTQGVLEMQGFRLAGQNVEAVELELGGG